MPLYKYRAVTKTGDIVEYRTDAPNRYALLTKLKNNDLLPISITSINVKVNRRTKNKEEI